MISPDAASAIIGAIQFSFALSVLPTIANRRAQVPRWTSGLTGGGLWVIAVIYADLGMGFAAASTAFCALAWTAVFVARPVRPT